MANLRTRLALLATLCGLAGVGLNVAASAPNYLQEEAAWRAERAERLKTEDGWLSLVGLFWLEPGDNAVGSDPDGRIVLPVGPARAGRLVYDRGTVRLVAPEAAGFTVGGEAVTDRVLRADNEGDADVVRLGRVNFQVIKRGERHGIRVRDPESSARTGFKGLSWFPIDPTYRVEATFRRFDEPRQMAISTVIGTTESMLAPGLVEFTLAGQKHSLLPLVDDPAATRFFLILRDGTSSKETYGAGRYLYAEREGDRVILDFNRAYNPPCAYTPHATCPLPPPENRLAVRIEAGERYEH
jgi:hypothetical protein